MGARKKTGIETPLVTERLPGRTIHHDGREMLYFSGTSYLGISQLPAFKELIKEGIDRIGTHFGGSRLSNVKIDIFERAEEKLALLCGAESALLLSSGSFAGYVLTQEVPAESRIFVAPGTHSALWKNFHPPADMPRSLWEEQTLEQLREYRGKAIVLSNTIDPLFCKKIDMGWLKKAAEPERITVVADDSHGIGVMGPSGAGSFASWSGSLAGKTLFMGSLGKGMGIPAGYVLGDSNTIEKLRATRIFGGSSPPNPAFLYAWTKGRSLYKKQLQKLRSNISLLHRLIKTDDHFHHRDHFPVFHCKDPDKDRDLLQKQIVISAFNYPGPNDPKITRVVLNSLHREEDIEELVEAIGIP